jgi:hypothetical protein
MSSGTFLSLYVPFPAGPDIAQPLSAADPTSRAAAPGAG